MMNNQSAQRRRPSPFRLFLAASLVIVAALGVLTGTRWQLTVTVMVALALALLGGGRRVFKAAVYRTGDEVICRYAPWYESYTYGAGLLFPLLGVTALGSATPSDAEWGRVIGYFLIALGGLFAVFSVFMGSVSRLRITPSTLIIQIGRTTGLLRSDIRSISPRILKSGINGAGTLHVDVVYVPQSDRNSTKTLMLGSQFTVEPTNLLAALQMWQDSDPNDPQLLDRIETVLRQPRDIAQSDTRSAS